MTNDVLAFIDAEIKKLTQARALLASSTNGASPLRGRPAKRKWTMSAEAREKIAAAQRRRWAKVKRIAK